MPIGNRHYRRGLSILRKVPPACRWHVEQAFSGVGTFLDDVGQFVSHDCNVSNRREDSNGQYGIVDEPKVIQKDF